MRSARPILALALALAACGRDPPGAGGAAEAGLFVDPAIIELYERQTFRFDVLEIRDTGLVSVLGDPALSVATEDPTVAVASSDGVIVGMKAGLTTLRAARGLFEGTSRVTVRAGTLKSIEVTPSEVSLQIGETVQLRVEAVLDNGTRIDVTSGSAGTTYTPSHDLVTTSANGLVTAAVRGSGRITVDHGGLTAEVAVTVAGGNDEYVRLILEPAAATLTFGQRLTLAVSAERRDGGIVPIDATAEMVTFRASPSNIVAVNARGRVTAQRQQGEAVVTATYMGLGATSAISVRGDVMPTLTGLRIDPSTTRVVVGETGFVRILAEFSDGSVNDVTFEGETSVSIPDSFIAIYLGGGAILGQNEGSTGITATYRGFSARGTVEVIRGMRELVAIDLIAPITIAVNDTRNYQVLGRFNDGSTTDLTFDISTRVTVDDPSILTLGSGVVTGRRAGRTVLNATYLSFAFFDAQEIVVTNGPDPVVNLFFSPPQINMMVGGSATAQLFAVHQSGATGNVTFDPGVMFSSFGPVSFSVGAADLQISAFAGGFAEIDAFYQGFFAALPINIGGNGQLVAIFISAPAVLTSGDVASFSVWGQFADGSFVELTFDPQLSLTVSAPRVINVTPGSIAALRPGTSDLTASYMGQTAVTSIRVTMAPDPMTGIFWQPSTVTMSINDTPVVTLMATYQSGNTANVTFDPSVGYVPSGSIGLNAVAGGIQIFAFGFGQASIEAFLNGFTAFLPVDVTGMGMVVGLEIIGPNQIPVGSMDVYQVIAWLSDGSRVDVTFDPGLSLSVTNPGVLFAGGGVMSGLSPGQSFIDVFYQGFFASLFVDVLGGQIVSLFWQPGQLSVPIGQTRFSTLFAQDISGTLFNVSADPNVFFALGGPVQLQSLGPAGAEVRGVAPGGNGEVTAFYQGLMATLPVTVGMSATLTGITVSPMSLTLDVGDSEVLVVTAHFSDGTSQVVTGASMTSNSPMIARVDVNGSIVGISPGSTTIVVVYGNFSAVVQVQVNAAVMLTITSIVPDTILVGSPDTTITINGTGFSRNDTVFIAGVPIMSTTASSTRITATVPSWLLFFPGELDVFVMNAAGAQSNVVFISVGQPPVIDSYSPQSVLEGSSIVVTAVGMGLIDLSFSAGDLGITVLESAFDGTWVRLRVTAPANTMPGPRIVTVSNDFGSATMTINVIDSSSLMDLVVNAGQTVTLSGTNAYNNVTVQTGGRIAASGNATLAIIAAGSINIRGTIDVSGAAGGQGFSTPAAGGNAGPGGAGGGGGGDGDAINPGAGGTGSPAGNPAWSGFGAGTPGGDGGGDGAGGAGAFQCGAGGGGGALGGAGGSGGGDFGPGSGGFGGFPGGRGSSFGAGTGGGGGTTCGNNSGGGGGGGGGGLVLQTANGGAITIDGEIRANGGNGGGGFNGTGGGGGGSGGRIEIIAPGGTINVNDTISVVGGNGGSTDFGDGGGAGGGGIIVLDASPGGTVNAALGFLDVDGGAGGTSLGSGAGGGSGAAGTFQISRELAPLALLACTACLRFGGPEPCERFSMGAATDDVPVVLSGDPIGFFAFPTDVEPADCRVEGTLEPAWELALAPEGASFELSVHPEIPRATVRAVTTGAYRIRARLGDEHVDLDFEVRPLDDDPAAVPEVVFLQGECSDLELHGEHVLCVGEGVRVLSATTGAQLGRTREPVPARYGVASNGALFATAAYGCGEGTPKCPMPEAVFPGGARIYTLHAQGWPEPRAMIRLGHADEVALTEDRLYVTHTPANVTAFDITNPSAPREVGCTRTLDRIPSSGLPAAAGARLYVLTNTELIAYATEDLERTCDDPAGVLARTPMKAGFRGGRALYVTETRAEAMGMNAIQTWRLEGSTFTEIDALHVGETIAAARAGDTIYILQSRRLLELELAEGRIVAARLLRDDLDDLDPTAMLAKDGRLLIVARSPPP